MFPSFSKRILDNACRHAMKLSVKRVGFDFARHNVALFRELGPPDLVHIIKSIPGGKQQTKELGSYHYVHGVDVSSSASIAAYVNELTYSLETNLGWFRNNPWKITQSVYCTYNAFSNVDVRVEARIPGGVTAYAISPHGGRIPATPEIWMETFVSAILRAILHQNVAMTGLRRMEPLPTEDHERRFLEASAKLFWNGWHLGSPHGQPTANNVSNYLVAGIMDYFEGCQRPQTAQEFFEPFAKQDFEINSLIARCLLLSDQEPAAIRLLHDTLMQNNSLATLLTEQCDFLLHKQRYSEAVEIAKMAVRASPVDYSCWLRLALAHIRNGDHSLALIALNNCPVTLPSDDQLTRMPPPVRISLPRRDSSSAINEGHTSSSSSSSSPPACDSILERLRAPSLRGSLKEVYVILVQLCKAIGWDELLKLRARVFVMEEEYRNDRNGHMNETMMGGEQRLQTQEQNQGQYNGTSKDPKERMDQEKEHDQNNHQAQQDTCEKHTLSCQPSKNTTAPPSSQATLQQDNMKGLGAKRLCERWLDNLFMILFEDMRVYTIYRSEMQHFRNESIPYRRTLQEWLIIGDLCRRLCYSDDAKEAYKHCVESTLCRPAWLALLEIYTEEDRLSHALTAASKLLLAEANAFESVLHPTPVSRQIFKLTRNHGVERIKTTLVSLNLTPPINALLLKYVETVVTQKALGHDY